MSHVDAETQQLMKDIFISKVLNARARPMDEKILDGPRLFDINCQISRSGIRSQFPHFTPEQVEQELDRRLAISRRIDAKDIYRNVEGVDE